MLPESGGHCGGQLGQTRETSDKGQRVNISFLVIYFQYVIYLNTGLLGENEILLAYVDFNVTIISTYFSP